MKKIYIILMHSYTVPSRFIKLFTKAKYSHVGISFDKDCNTVYSFGRRKPTSIFNAGFTIDFKDGEFFRLFNKTICKIYEVEVTDEQYNTVKKIIDVMSEDIKNYKYDYFGIIPRYFGIPITFKNKFVCSYFVATVLEQAKIYNFDKKTCFIEPKDFENLKEFHEIYNGGFLLYK